MFNMKFRFYHRRIDCGGCCDCRTGCARRRVARGRVAGSSMAKLEAGVQAAEAIRAVKRLQHAYAQYQEAGLWSDMDDLFAADAVGEFPGREVTGKAGFLGYFMEEAGRKRPGLAAGQLNAHLVNQPIVTLGADGRTAKGTWHDLAVKAQFGGIGFLGLASSTKMTTCWTRASGRSHACATYRSKPAHSRMTDTRRLPSGTSPTTSPARRLA